jgi:hypothetical protein
MTMRYFGASVALLVFALSPLAVSAQWYGPYQYGYPTSYPYTQLNCYPTNQTTSLGSSVTFNAVGGTGTYNWSTPDRTYVGIGPRLTVILEKTGMQNVVVTSGTQTAVCSVTVNPNYNPSPNYSSPNVTLNIVAPGLPNTGYEPSTALQITLALAGLFVVGVYLYPYGRKAFTALRG